MREKRSTKTSAGAFSACASSTRREILCSVESPARFDALTMRPPEPLTAPEYTSAPGPFSTGPPSPVTGDSSIVEAPSTTTPSTASRSPGLMTTISPTATSSAATTPSPPAHHPRPPPRPPAPHPPAAPPAGRHNDLPALPLDEHLVGG